jgi:hypothetical protein
MSEVKKIRITMLGSSQSGKTMYLLGLYAVMSAGLDGYSLHARDLDVDIDLTEAWDALDDEGELPVATTETKPYELSFQRGFTRLIDIEWLDYRGGAMTQKGGEADTAQLVNWLAESHSVYLTLDGSKLVGGVRDDNVLEMRRATSANLMGNHVRRAANTRGGSPPSLVVLITKSDLLIAGASSPSRALDDAVEAVKRLLPIAFVEGATTMVCPVTLGDLGDSRDGLVDASRVSPRWVQKPIVFSLAQYFQGERAPDQEAITVYEQDIAAEEQALVDLRGKMFGNFRKASAQRIQQRLIEARHALDAHRQLVDSATDRDRRLLDQLVGPRFFVDGVETEFVHG